MERCWQKERFTVYNNIIYGLTDNIYSVYYLWLSGLTEIASVSVADLLICEDP